MKIAILFLLNHLIYSIAYSQNPENKKFEFSIGSGALLPGNVQAAYELDFDPDNTVSIKNKISPMMKIIFDYNIRSKFSVGLNINYAKFNINDILYKEESMKVGNEVSLGVWDGSEHIIPLDDIKMVEINTSIKWRILLTEKMTLKACLYLGYRRTFSGSPDARENGVVLNYNVEYLYFVMQKYFLIGDLGFMAQPFGGVENVGYVRTIGVPYFNLGLGIKL
jgi:hypothetical protein